MKGIVFTEFLSMVEQKFGYEMVDSLLNETDLPSQGIYTAIGTYSHTEIVSLIVKLNEKTQIPIPDLVYTFGRYLFVTFSKSYKHFFEGVPNAFAFLASIHDYIHVEVKKLYPDAQLPHFEISQKDDNKMVMIYASDRKMATLAHGLIDECLAYFNENAEVKTELLSEDGSRVSFEINKK